MIKLIDARLPTGVVQIRKAMLDLQTMEVVDYPIDPPFLEFDFSILSEKERFNSEKAWPGEYVTAFDGVAIRDLYHLFTGRSPIPVKYQGREYTFHSVVDDIPGDGTTFYPVVLSPA